MSTARMSEVQLLTLSIVFDCAHLPSYAPLKGLLWLEHMRLRLRRALTRCVGTYLAVFSVGTAFTFAGLYTIVKVCDFLEWRSKPPFSTCADHTLLAREYRARASERINRQSLAQDY